MVNVTRNEIFHLTVCRSLQVTVKQVNHDEFQYFIDITNHTGADVQAAVRIFMAPTIDAHGNEFPLDVNRRLFIEMDKFVAKRESSHPSKLILSKTDD